MSSAVPSPFVSTFHDIVKRLWNADFSAISRVADAHISRLRRKIERDARAPDRLKQVRGVGYKLVPFNE